MSQDDGLKKHFIKQRVRSSQKRANNRKTSAKYLVENGIEFESKKDGVHLIIKKRYHHIDFWPGTGKYFIRRKYDGEVIVENRGVRLLVDWINQHYPNKD